jgi:hypothetical protein
MNCELVRRSLFAVRRSLFTVRRSLFTVPSRRLSVLCSTQIPSLKVRPARPRPRGQGSPISEDDHEENDSRTSGSELKGSPPSTPSNLHRSQTVGRSPRLFAFILNPIFS